MTDADPKLKPYPKIRALAESLAKLDLNRRYNRHQQVESELNRMRNIWDEAVRELERGTE